MVNYLAKFLPFLSDMTEPLPRLEDREVEWCWLQQHQKAFTTVKQYLVKAPGLKYYDIKDVTIQCDATKTVMGAVLMHDVKDRICNERIEFSTLVLSPLEIPI